MTVEQLIAKLQTMPPEAEVIYRYCSDWEVLDESDVRLVTAKDSRKKVLEDAKRVENGGYYRIAVLDGAVCYRGGRFCEAYALYRYPEDEKPVYKDVVTFPGN